jgi:hypothetical protein
VTLAFVLNHLPRYAFIFPVGLMGLGAALGHIVFPVSVAQAIGWQTSLFQFEVGAANLAIRLAGLYAAFRSFDARLATPGNAGPILFTDQLTPTAIFLLRWLTRPRGGEREAVPRRTPARREG